MEYTMSLTITFSGPLNTLGDALRRAEAAAQAAEAGGRLALQLSGEDAEMAEIQPELEAVVEQARAKGIKVSLEEAHVTH